MIYHPLGLVSVAGQYAASPLASEGYEGLFLLLPRHRIYYGDYYISIDRRILQYLPSPIGRTYCLPNPWNGMSTLAEGPSRQARTVV